MAATFPGGVKVFTTKQAGDQIASAHINDLQDEVVAVETELRKTTGSVVSHGSLAGLSNNDQLVSSYTIICPDDRLSSVQQKICRRFDRRMGFMDADYYMGWRNN